MAYKIVQLFVKQLDLPVNKEHALIFSSKKHMIELANINANVNTLLDEQISPIAIQSNIPELDINQVYFEDEGVDSDIRETTKPYLQEPNLVLETEVL